LLVLVPLRFAPCLLRSSRHFPPFLVFSQQTMMHISGHSSLPALLESIHSSRYSSRRRVSLILTVVHSCLHSVTETVAKWIYFLAWVLLVINPLSKRVSEYAIQKNRSPGCDAKLPQVFALTSLGNHRLSRGLLFLWILSSPSILLPLPGYKTRILAAHAYKRLLCHRFVLGLP